jgi:CSLREA domain-containing protein
MYRKLLALRLFSLVVLWLALFAAQAATITVNSTADTVTPNDGLVTLREAITAISAGTNLGDPDIIGQSPGTFGVNDAINFAIPGGGVQTITPASSLPFISKTVTINGYSQPGSSANTNPFGQGLNTVLTVELGGANGALGTNGAASNGTVIRGLVFASGVSFGIGTSGNTLQGSFIGTNATGTAAAGVGGFGVLMAGSNTQIGGTTPAARNLISGISNAGIGTSIFTISGEVIQGNLIGTNAAGTGAIPNGAGIALLSGTISNITIGGTALGAGNVVSGNTNGGIQITGTNIVIQGNYVGTDVTGTAALGNSPVGIVVSAGPPGGGPIIGGTAAGAGNVISGNGNMGLSIAGNALVQGNRIGTNAAGTAGLGSQGIGIEVFGSNNTIGGTTAGAANIIAFQTGGLPTRAIGTDINTSGNAWLTNSIHDNGGTGGILLAPGANTDTAAPTLTAATFAAGNVTVSGSMPGGLPAGTYRIEFFSNVSCDAAGRGEGLTFLGAQNISTPGTGSSFGPFTFAVPPGQSIITMTATSAANSSSAFSNCTTSLAGTTTTILSSVNPSTVGQSVTFTATVSGGSSPTGTVQFFDGVSALGSPVALSGGTAALVTSALTAGTHSIAAVYSGDAGNLTSSSAPVSQVVNGVGPGATTTALGSSVNPSTLGQSVTFTATVTGSSPTGTVQFKDGATNLGSPVSLAGGSAQLTTFALTVGTHSITAVYSGDVGNLTSTSPAVSQVVNAVVVPPGPSTPSQIPTLSDLALLVLVLLMGTIATAHVRARDRQPR